MIAASHRVMMSIFTTGHLPAACLAEEELPTTALFSLYLHIIAHTGIFASPA
jgi:hypothetical protein